MNDPAIRVENLGKLYRIGSARERNKTLREAMTDMIVTPLRSMKKAFRESTAPNEESDNHIWALKNVSFEVKRGEVVGIIGRNGAGKSTLLKILSRITEPTEGRVVMRGRVGSLLEVGTGFHSELTGEENIYLSGTILGMSSREISNKFDEIVAFAEMEKFINTPVKHYSSGMYMRLAFAVAAHLEPEILLIDEVLAVGDAAFQKKCLGKMGEVAKEGRTVLFVSHNMRAVTDLCQRGIWIDKGILVADGGVQQTVVDYLSSGITHQRDGVITDDMHVNATGDVYIRRVTLLGRDEQPINHLLFGEPLQLVADLQVCHSVKHMRLIVSIERFDGSLIAVLHHTDSNKEALFDAQPGNYRVRMDLCIPLMPGGYSIDVAAKPSPGYWDVGMSWDWVPRVLDFYVEQVSADGYVVLPTKGAIRPLARWQIKPI